MVRFGFAIAAVLGLSLIAHTTPVAAQSENRSSLAITGGALFPTANLVNDTSWVAGAQLQFPSGGGSGQFMLSADWTEVESSILGVSRWTTLVPVMLNYKFRFGGGSWYLGAGAGVIWASRAVPQMDLDDDLNFGWQALLGTELGSGWFVEGRVIASDQPEDDAMYGVQLGYRF